MRDVKRLYDKLFLNKYIEDALYKEGILTNDKKEQLNDLNREIKKEIRESYKEKERRQYLYHEKDGKGYGRIVNGGGDWDGFWQKIFFEGECWTEEEKREFIEDNWVNPEPSQYDCTGQEFTWAIDCFNVPSGVVCYIRYAVDV